MVNQEIFFCVIPPSISTEGRTISGLVLTCCGFPTKVPSLGPRESASQSLMAKEVKNRHAMQETQETWVRSLSKEDPPEEEMAAHSSILA